MIPTIRHSKAPVRNFRKPSGMTLCVVLMALQLQTTANQRVIQTETLLSNLRYEIELKLDYRNAAFTGIETVRFTNSGREDLDHLSFHLYPNVGLTDEDETWLSIRRVTANGRELRPTLRARQTIVRVELPAKLAIGQSLELKLEFTGRVPQVQREEASLLAHFLQEVNDAVNEERPTRDARDIFFAGEESMLLGYFYPILATRPSQLSDQSLVAGASGIAVSEAATYEVNITVAEGLTVIGSAPLLETTPVSGENDKRISYLFKGSNLRGFGLAIAERLKSAEQQVDSTRVVSYFREGDDRLGKRALEISVRALETYTQAFGAYPYPLLQVLEMPLPAGHSSSELSSLIILAQAYFIDFDSPKSSRLPSFLREQADVIKTSFEFSLAHGVARQWWGVAVGSDSERFPYLDEALSSYSAAYYHEAIYGKGLGDIILKQQLHGTYQAYRMLGGADMEVDKPAREFRNGLQYTAIVQAKGAILFSMLRRELGDKKFFDVLKNYFSANRFRFTTPDQLRASFATAAEDQRNVRALFQRWLKEKHGDEDIGAPDLTLVSPSVSKIRALGRVFVKIGKTAAKPF
ncbi:MAG: M1 family aminopeptidase [Blastocatellia bacterium]